MVANAGDYQPEAIALAQQVLAQRSISPEERSVAESISKERTIESPVVTGVNILQDGAYNLLQTLAGRGEGSTIDRWINYLLILLGINLAYSLFQLVRAIAYPYSSITLLIYGMPETLINVFVLPLLGYWLYKRSKKGWTLTMLFFLVEGSSHILGAYSYIRFREYFAWLHRRPASFDYIDFGLEIVYIGIYAYFTYYLLQPAVLDTFQVDANRKKQTLIVSIILALLLNIIVLLA